MSQREELYLAACCGVNPGLSRAAIKRLLPYVGGAERLYQASASLLGQSGLCTAKQLAAFCAGRSQELVRRIQAYVQASGTLLLSFTSPDYPELLRELSDAPLLLYLQGQLPKEGLSIAIVGSRSCTPYGAKAARGFAYQLAQQGATIISGGARGIDSAAHQGALAAGGRTVAVLGCGLDQCYPPENASLFRAIARQGALLSEYPPGTPPLHLNFPARNRIIAGLAQGVVVAEARAKSGALITARAACDENRDVYCIPGDIYSGASSGCHELIRQGAKLVDSPQQVLEDSREQAAKQASLWQQGSPAWPAPPAAPSQPPPDLEPGSRAQQLWQELGEGSLSLVELAERLDCPLDSLSVELLQLQLAGLIKEVGLQLYSRA